jgi:hypothetical protein|tara:strand:+ start:1385 stop:1660 length:276 start_codon:yes stop_codon:yes gene_type:complete
MKMKIAMALLIALMTQGCVYQEVSSGDLAISAKFCEVYGGVEWIAESWTGDTKIKCYDKTNQIHEKRALKMLFERGITKSSNDITTNSIEN